MKRWRLGDKALLAVGFLLLAATGAWLLRVQRVVDDAGARPLARLAQAAGLDERLGDAGDRRPVVALVFRLSDCDRHIDDLASWNRLHASGEARILGLVPDAQAARSDVEDELRGSGIDYPVYAERETGFRELLAELGFSRTPLVAVLDPAGRIRLVGPAAGSTLPDVLDRFLDGPGDTGRLEPARPGP